MKTKSNVKNIRRMIEGLAEFNSTPDQGTTRVLFTEPELKAREYMKKEMAKLGLTVSEDGAGNIFAVLEGADPSLPPVWTGSHIDTVLNAGNFDGMAGVVCGLEAVRMIKEQGIKPNRSINVIIYTSEEPTRFGLSCLGSRALAGVLDTESMKKLTDKDGNTLYDMLNSLGFDTSRIKDDIRKPGDVYASVELHIEQNRHLDDAGIPIGLVRGICAPTIYAATATGCQSHAGGTSMADRRDAFAAVCEFETVLERLARTSKGEYVTATVGCANVFPGAVNVIPGLVKFSVDIRSIDMESKELLMAELEKERVRIEKERNVKIELKLQNHDVPLKCDERIMDKLRNSCDENGIKYMELISGPYHDSLFVGKFAPTAMIFVPSKNGISHSVDEWTDYEYLEKGTQVLADTLYQLADE